VRCAKFGVQCIQDLEKPKQRACKRCAGLKEKCKQPEVENGGARSGVDKGKSKAIATSPRGGKKRKKVKKSVAIVVIVEIQEVVGPSKAGSGNQVFLDRMDRLVESMGELTGEVHQMRQAQRAVA